MTDLHISISRHRSLKWNSEMDIFLTFFLFLRFKMMAHCAHWSWLSPIFKASSHLFEIETHFSVDVVLVVAIEENITYMTSCYSLSSFWWDHFCQYKNWLEEYYGYIAEILLHIHAYLNIIDWLETQIKIQESER